MEIIANIAYILITLPLRKKRRYKRIHAIEVYKMSLSKKELIISTINSSERVKNDSN